MAQIIQIRGDDATAWVAANPILAEREMGIETNTNKFKFGDGVSVWNSLPYAVFVPDFTEGVGVLVGSTLTFDCTNDVDKKFTYSTLVANATVNFVNNSNAKMISIVLAITGSGIVITFPADVRMARYNETTGVPLWNATTKALTISSTAAGDLHEFILMRTGSVFLLRYDGPYRP